MARIFISYRRVDKDLTGRIYDRLVERYGRDNVFKDVDSIPPGVDFRSHIEQAVNDCDALLVIIGPDWVNARDRDRRRRLDNPDDFVRIEIEHAIRRNIRLIPVLIHDAAMPGEWDLPLSLAQLAFQNATQARSDADFHPDVDRLIAALDRSSAQEPLPASTSKEPWLPALLCLVRCVPAGMGTLLRWLAAGLRGLFRGLVACLRVVRRRPRRVAIALGATAALLVLGAMVYLRLSAGIIKIELSDPAAQVELRLDGDMVELGTLQRPLRLRAGEHGLVVSGKGFETVSRSFTVKRGPNDTLRVTLVASKDGPRRALSATQKPRQDLSTTRKPTPKIETRHAEPIQGTGRAPAKPKDAFVAKVSFDEARLRQDGCAEQEKVPREVTNSLGMKLVFIPAGEFTMGSNVETTLNNRRQHRVRISKPFYLGAYEVTQEEYEKVVGENPSAFKDPGGRTPVEGVSWDDAQKFCEELSALAKERAAGRRYRLPTEAEWEYACRADAATLYSFGDASDDLNEYAQCPRAKDGTVGTRSTSRKKTSSTVTIGPRAVGEKKPNAWGLYDMHGNVWEWCADWYARDYYEKSPTDDPLGPSSGESHVLRGGSVSDSSRTVFQCSYRRCLPVPTARSTSARILCGFRVASPTAASAEPPVGR